MRRRAAGTAALVAWSAFALPLASFENGWRVCAPGGPVCTSGERPCSVPAVAVWLVGVGGIPTIADARPRRQSQ